MPNRVLYGYGGDAYFITDGQEALENEFRENGVRIAVPLRTSDYYNREFAAEPYLRGLLQFVQQPPFLLTGQGFIVR